MDTTRGPDPQEPTREAASFADPRSRPQRRGRVLAALIRFVVALALVAGVGYVAYDMVSDRPAPPRRQNFERTFTVEAVDPEYATHSAPVSTFGEVVATRTLDIRSLVQGRVMEVNTEFQVGRQVEQGDVLARIDPYSYDGAVVAAQAALADAQLGLREAEESRRIEELNLETARDALTAAQTDLDRARALLSSGSVTEQTVDTRELTVAERQQAVTQSQSNIFTLEAQIERQNALIEQARYDLEAARRDRANTEVAAPFNGVVTAESVTEGGYVTSNESIGTMYDTDALNVRFTIADSDYGQLRVAGLVGRGITATWDVGADPVTIPGEITRTAPQIEATTGGVEIYASLDPEAAGTIRPGTFVSVEVAGVDYENTLRIPETAVYDNNHLYVLREGRMASVPVSILDRVEGDLIVRADIPEDERVITTRLSQAGEGVAVQLEGEEDQGGRSGRGGREAGQTPARDEQAPAAAENADEAPAGGPGEEDPR